MDVQEAQLFSGALMNIFLYFRRHWVVAALMAGTTNMSYGWTADLSSTEPCRIKGVPREVRCGKVQMPENPDTPTGRVIDIHFAVVPALAKRAAPDPVFVFAGGPGQSAIDIAPQVLASQALLNARRDVVFVDQRGTGRSNRLSCTPPEPTAPLSESLDNAVHLARLDTCIQKLIAQGNDTRQYATWIAVRDIDTVRAALGLEQINLWASSYGTRAALEYLRQFPTRVRAAVLDGVVPPEVVLPQSFAQDNEAALDHLIEQCANEPRCNSRYPHLDKLIDRLLAQADAGTLRYTITHPLTGRREDVSFDRSALMASLRAPLYMPVLAAALPHALTRAAAGDANALVALTQALAGPTGDSIAEVMHFAVICAEDLPRLDALSPDTPTRFAHTLEGLYRRVCPKVPVRPVPKEFLVLSDAPAPVLLLSGGADPATPPRHGEAVRSQLKNAQHRIAPHLSHGVAHQGCAPELIHRFIRQAHFDGIDGSCLDKLPAPTFFFAPDGLTQ